jgi:hypothetical protein
MVRSCSQKVWVYRLVGEVGELAVPDSLHALLAARLDALDPEPPDGILSSRHQISYG